MYERVQESYDRVAARYADEFGDELAGKPIDRALLNGLADLVTEATAAAKADSDGADHGHGRRVADIGCGPGHITSYLADHGLDMVGIDISPGMIDTARARVPGVAFRVGSMLALPALDGELSGAVAMYSIIHLRPEDRPLAFAEFARAIVPGGWLLVAFHISRVGQTSGEIMHADEWWGERVDLDFYYLDPDDIAAHLVAADFTVMARTDRQPWPGAEHPSVRSYLFCQRNAAAAEQTGELRDDAAANEAAATDKEEAAEAA